jgi:molybdopterin synthase catalytic subunit
MKGKHVKLIVTQDRIEPATTYDLIEREHAGSVVLHYAVVKEQIGHGGTTAGIEYGTAGDTTVELEEIAAELKGKWKLEDVVLIRRIGRLEVGDIISLIAASSPNSEDAFASCRHGIARMKKMSTIRKTETYA